MDHVKCMQDLLKCHMIITNTISYVHVAMYTWNRQFNDPAEFRMITVLYELIII